MKSLHAWVLGLFKDEFKNSETLGKWLLATVVVNVPFPDIFIPYFTQGVTIILISIFLKKYNATFPDGSMLVTGLCIVIMIVQLFWFPYFSQLVTLVLLGILYASFSTYKNKNLS